MNYLSQFFWKKSTIGYGCLVLLGSVTVAGVSELEIKGQIFSKWFKKIEEGFKNNQSSAPVESQPVTIDNIAHPFVTAGDEVKKVALKVWPFLKGAFGAIWMLKDNWSVAFESIKRFFSNLLSSEILKKIFKNFHQKIWNILVFAVAGGEGRDTFVGLFGVDKKDKTLLMGQLLLGQEIPNAKNFKIKPNVFHHLFSRWLDKPKEIAKKLDGLLSKSINKLTEKLKGSNGSSNNVYWLEIPTVDAYLDTKTTWQEKIFTEIWQQKIREKITNGTDDKTEAKTWIQKLGESLGGAPSQKPSQGSK